MNFLVIAFPLVFILKLTVQDFTMTILHAGNLHWKFVEEKINAKRFYGIARFIAFVRSEKNANPSTVYFDTIDWSPGSIWFSVRHWQIVEAFLDSLPADALSLGDKEMSHGRQISYKDDDLEHFFHKLENRTIVCVNCDTKEGKYLKRSTILEVGEDKVKIGVIGYLWKYDQIKNVDVVRSIREEVKTLKNQGINIIIALAQGSCKSDLELVINITDIDVIISGESPYEKYLTIIQERENKQVLDAHADVYDSYILKLSLSFDDIGVVTKYSGNRVRVHETVPQLLSVNERKTRDALVLGQSRINLDHMCAWQECNLGNLVCDSFIDDKAASNTGEGWTDYPIALMHNAAFRGSINTVASNNYSLTYDQVKTALPDNHTMTTLILNGSVLKEMLEFSVGDLEDPKTERFLQVSGLHVVYDLSKPANHRVVFLKARCGNCDVPIYEHVGDGTVYTIIVPSYLAEGNAGFGMLKKHIKNKGKDTVIAPVAVKHYVEYYKTVSAGLEERIVVLNMTKHLLLALRSGSEKYKLSYCLYVICAIFKSLYDLINIPNKLINKHL